MYNLSHETKKLLEKSLGIPYEEIINMNLEDEIQFVEGKIGKKLAWNKNDKIDGLPIFTNQDVDKEIKKLIKNRRWNRNV